MPDEPVDEFADDAEVVRLAWVKADGLYPALHADEPPDPKARGGFCARRVLDVLIARGWQRPERTTGA